MNVGIGTAISYEGYLDSDTLLSTNIATTSGRVQSYEITMENSTTAPMMTAKVHYSTAANWADWGSSIARTDWGYTTACQNSWLWEEGTAYRLVKVFSGEYDSMSGWIKMDKPSIQERLRKIMQNRCAPSFIRNLKSLDRLPDIREMRARETLRRVIGEEKYRYFLRKGFITVMNSKSGNTFQIFPGHGITNVFFRGTMTERLCVVMRGDFPPTDSLIMRYLMILNNEEQFRLLAVKHTVMQTQRQVLMNEPDRRSLTEIFASLQGKKVA